MDAILGTVLEVAHGMSYLHARSIVHGDLTGSNVLLQECLVRALACLAVCASGLGQVFFGLSQESMGCPASEHDGSACAPAVGFVLKSCSTPSSRGVARHGC